MPDVIVVGAGNAAICAAMAAKERGADVVVLEKAERGERGGNTFFTGGGFRFPYKGIDDIRALMPDLSEQETLAVMHDFKAKGLSYREISILLNDRGYAARGSKCWTDHRVKWLLRPAGPKPLLELLEKK